MILQNMEKKDLRTQSAVESKKEPLNVSSEMIFKQTDSQLSFMQHKFSEL